MNNSAENQDGSGLYGAGINEILALYLEADFERNLLNGGQITPAIDVSEFYLDNRHEASLSGLAGAEAYVTEEF